MADSRRRSRYPVEGGEVTPADYSGMEPRKNPLQPIFRDHNCGGCDNGRKPCREGNYNSCSNPRARND